jgi:hypothetical protein
MTAILPLTTDCFTRFLPHYNLKKEPPQKQYLPDQLQTVGISPEESTACER